MRELHTRKSRDQFDFCAVEIGQLVLDDGLLIEHQRLGIADVDAIARRPRQAVGQVTDSDLVLGLVRLADCEQQTRLAAFDFLLGALRLDIGNLGRLQISPPLGSLQNKVGRLCRGAGRSHLSPA